MLVNVDAKALEWLVCAFLSKDKVAYEEIRSNVDQHTANQIRFGLPSRLIAKTFVFRLIYGGSAYSYANDPDFTVVSTSEKFWQQVIDEFYNKYQGVSKWHTSLLQEASSKGKLVMPTGRIFNFSPEKKGYNIEWPRTKILNYPVQGSGADLMTLARVSFYRRFKEGGFSGKLVSTIHDSIVVDVPEEEVERVCILFEEVFNDIPANFERIFGIPFDLPTKCEVEVGPNKYDLKPFVRSVTI